MASIPATPGRFTLATRTTASRSRAFAWFGVGTFVLGLVVTWVVQFGVSDSELRAGGPEMINALDSGANEAIYRISSGFGFIVAAMLVAFGAGLRRMLQERDGESDIPAIIWGSTLVAAAGLAIAMSFRAQVFDGFDYYAADASSHVTLNRLQQDTVLTSWVGMLGAVAATAYGGLRTGMFPKWLGIVSAVMLLIAVALCLGGVAFPAHIPVMIWLACTSAWALRQSN